MISVLNVIYLRRSKVSQTLSRYFQISGEWLAYLGQSGLTSGQWHLRIWDLGRGGTYLSAKLKVYACEGTSHAHPGYLFSSQVPPISSFFSYITCSTLRPLENCTFSTHLAHEVWRSLTSDTAFESDKPSLSQIRLLQLSRP